MFSWFSDEPQTAASRTVDAVPGFRLPPTSTLMVPLPIPGTTPVSNTLPRPQSEPLPPVPAHTSAVSSIFAPATDVPSPVLVLLPAAPPPPLFPLSSSTGLTGRLKAVYEAVRQSNLVQLQMPAWPASASATVNHVVGPYRELFVFACVAIQQSSFAELVIPRPVIALIGSGMLRVKDFLTRFLGDRPFDPLESAILFVRRAIHSQADRRGHPMTMDNVLRPEFVFALLEPVFASLFEADASPFPRWLRTHFIFRWFRTLLWAALFSVSVLVCSWFRKLSAMLPWWLRQPIEGLFPPPPPFTLFLEAFDNYISNELPTHLIRLQDMRLVGRDDIREALRPRIAAMTEADLTYQTLYYNLVNPNHQVDCDFTLAIQRYLKFAIFSHQWGTQEPSFRTMMEASPEALCMFPQCPGFQKLFKFCEEARHYGCAYAWYDACCINKESSSELQESIRSMYRWYQNAEICIALLGESVSKEDFEHEPWFTRGWTLQELLAPRRIRFYGKYWIPINWQSPWTNDKLDSGLMEAIEKVTMIPQDELKRFTPSCSRVYEKMIWASKRRTTKVEDRAYCLLGIFDITISISYGEGCWAFHRLMEAILQRCGESGIFAWSGEPSPYSLAIPASPACYMEGLRKLGKKLKLTESVAFTVTKDGLDVELLVVNAKMTSTHRHNKGSRLPWDEPRPSPNLADVRFHDIVLRPKWTLRRNWLKESVQISADERDLKRCFTWAIGIVCSRDADGHATLEAGKEYMWWLIGKVRNGRKSVWVRTRTQNIATLRIEGNVRSRLETVHIPHRL